MSRSTKLMDVQKEKTRMEVAQINGWGKYIHMKYDGSGALAPNIDLDARLDAEELGCILMHPVKKVEVHKTNRTTFGVDFGTRNSMVAMQSTTDDISYPFHVKDSMDGGAKLQMKIIPGIDKKLFTEFTNLS